MFKCLPVIHRWEEQIQHAKKEMRFVEQDFSIRGEKDRARKIATQKIHTFAVALTKPLGHVVKTFEYIMREGRLHPFEGALLGVFPSDVIEFLCQGRTLTTGDPAELTLRNMEVDCNGTLEEAIRQVKILRKETSILTKEGMHKGANVASLQEVTKRGIFGLRWHVPPASSQYARHRTVYRKENVSGRETR